MGRKKEIKLGDIARELGVSIVSVSNAINGRKGVSDEMRARILEMAEQMGYRKKPAAEPAKKESYLIGVAVAERYVKEFPSFYMDIYKSIAREATKKGSITVLDVVDPRKEREGAAADSQVDGVLVIGQLSRDYILNLKNACGVPVVCVDYYDVDSDMDYVVTDGYDGMAQMTEMLIRRGYRSFQFVGNPLATKNIMDRYMGYCKALEKHGLKDQQKKVLPDRDPKGFRLDVEVPEELPEVFVCNCDKIAKLLIEKLAARGVRVPEDVGVTGFDNFHPETLEGRLLTTYENDGRYIAQTSVGILLKRMSGRTPAGIHVAPGRLVEGGTIRAGEEDADGGY